jgi:arginase
MNNINRFDNLLFIPHGHGQTKSGFNKNSLLLSPYIDSSINIVCLENKDTLLDSLNYIYNECLKYTTNSVFIGGDHSISISTINAVWKPGMKIIWIDAHPDINTISASKSKNYHGMPLAFLTGLENNILDTSNIIVPFSDIIYIGIRDIDEFEKTIIREHNITVIDYKLNETFMFHEIKNHINDNDILHISLDVDSLSSEYMPCTGTPVGDGITTGKMKNIIDFLSQYNINSMDIVELNFDLASCAHDIITSHNSLLEICKNLNIFKK